MAKRGPYTPKSGPLAGTTYSSYYRYQVARSITLGYESYSAQRAAEGLSTIRSLAEIIAGQTGMSMQEARDEARDIYNSQGYRGPSTRAGFVASNAQRARKRAIMRRLAEDGILDDTNRDDIADTLDY